MNAERWDVALPRLRSHRLMSEIGAALGAVLSYARASWRDIEAQRREKRASLAMSEMSEHLLRDIGAHDRWAVDPTRRPRLPLHLLLAPIAAAAVFASVVLPAEMACASKHAAPSVARAQSKVVGVATGAFVDGAPVYRLPPIAVVASRKVSEARYPPRAELNAALKVALGRMAELVFPTSGM